MTDVKVIYGPMFSGKTTELLKELDRVEKDGARVFLLKPNIDNRYSLREQVEVVTHDGLRRRAIPVSCFRDAPSHETTFFRLPREFLFAVGTDSKTIILAIDEVQFFSRAWGVCLLDELDRYNHARDKAELPSIKLIVSGLLHDCLRRPFGATPVMLAYANHIVHKTKLCECGRVATETLRTEWDDTEIIKVGGDETYKAVCPKCWYDHMSTLSEGQE